MIRLVILGAGGHGVVVADAAVSMNRWSDIQFLDDDPGLGPTVMGHQVVNTLGNWDISQNGDAEFIVAIGNNALRQEYLDDIERKNGVVAKVVHSSAVISPFADLSDGVAVCAGVVVNPRASVGKGAILNTSTTVDHDCVIGQAAHLSPGVHLSGNVQVGARAWLGIGSCVRQGVKIGADSIVGAGAAVVSDVPANSTVVGVPARPLG
jgi:sugar O-acyltransferase (sialic acid O-acetyltransferase NeuD family)